VGRLESPTNRARTHLLAIIPGALVAVTVAYRSMFKGVTHILVDANSSATYIYPPFLTPRFTHSYQAPPIAALRAPAYNSTAITLACSDINHDAACMLSSLAAASLPRSASLLTCEGPLRYPAVGPWSWPSATLSLQCQAAAVSPTLDRGGLI
jgi:hypothetical protein